MNPDLAGTRERIHQASHLVVSAHVRPDGDAVGSLLGLSLSLMQSGKKATPVLKDGIPHRFDFLPGADLIQQEFPQGEFTLITVDVSDMDRLGFNLPEAVRPAINIDHHPTNTHFAELNLVYPDLASTTEILYRLMDPLDLPINLPVATNLLAGLITDTIGFRTSNVSSETLRIAADLMDRQAPFYSLYRKLVVDRPFNGIRYWSNGLARLHKEDGLIWTKLTVEDRINAGYTGTDDADLVDLLTTVQEAEVVVVLIEQSEGITKVSWRSIEPYDVAKIASQFGGGGHKQAAGAMINGSLEEVEMRVIEATQTLI